MPYFGTVPHSTGRSCASEIEEQITNMVPTTIQDCLVQLRLLKCCWASVRDELDEKLVDNMPAGLEAIPAGGRRVGSERARLWPGSFSVRPMPSVWSSCGDSGLRRRPLDSGLALPVSPAHKLGRKRRKRVEKVECVVGKRVQSNDCVRGSRHQSVE